MAIDEKDILRLKIYPHDNDQIKSEKHNTLIDLITMINNNVRELETPNKGN